MYLKNIASQLISTPLSSNKYPDYFILESEVTNQCKQMAGYTEKKGLFAKKDGASGWEYAFSVFFLIDQIYPTPLVSGNYESVKINHSTKFDPIYSDQNKKVKFDLKIDAKTYKTKDYETEKIRDNLKYGYIATFHSHPRFYHDSQTSQYTFFSAQDISSLVYGNIPISGLVAGNKMWLACKTDKSQMISQELLNEASRIELQEGNDAVVNFVKSNMREFGVVFYYGGVGGRLNRV